MYLTLERRALAEGVCFAAVTLFVVLTGTVFSLFTFLVYILAPMPFCVLVQRQGVSVGVISLALYLLLSAVVFCNNLSLLWVGFQVGSLGFLMGVLFYKKFSFGVCVTILCLTSAIWAVLGLAVDYRTMGAEKFLQVLGTEKEAEEVMALYSRAGLFEGMTLDEQEIFKEQVLKIRLELLPADAAINSIVMVAITYLLARLLLTRLGYTVGPTLAFDRWRFPWQVIWGLILALVFLLAGDGLSWPLAMVAGKNIIVAQLLLHLTLGIAVAVYFIKKRGFPRIVNIIILVLAILCLPYTIATLLVLGVIDPLINIRRLPET